MNLCQNEHVYLFVKLLALIGTMAILATVGMIMFALLTHKGVRDEVSRNGNSAK